MQEVYAATLGSMQADMARMDRVALNLTNATTPAYKREVMAVRPFSQLVDAAATQNVGVSNLQSAPFSVEVVSDMRPGALKATGQKLDVALEGKGFFEVTSKTGPAYSRQGNFQIDASGRLVTVQGYPVMGLNGEIRLETKAPTIDNLGRVFEGDKQIDQLKLVDFDHPEKMARMGEGYFAAGESIHAVEGGSTQVRQGYIEGTNVSTMHEMIQLMETMRHFESMVRVSQGYDDMLGTAIRKLGEA